MSKGRPADIIAKYALEPHMVDIAGQRFDILAVRDQDALLAASDDLAYPPYGLLLWESSVALAKVLAVRGRAGLEGRRVLELGCGIGLAGLAAAHGGAIVVMTDYLGVALDIAAENARRNRLANVETRLVDWRDWTGAERFDLIIGADIAYETDMHGALLRVLATGLRPGGAVLLADPSRDQGAAFTGHLAAIGWQVATEQFIEPDASGRSNMAAVAVNVHTLRPPGTASSCAPC